MSRLTGVAVPRTMRRQVIIHVSLVSLLGFAVACGAGAAPTRDAGNQDAEDSAPARGGSIPSPVDGGHAGPAVVITGPARLSDAVAQLNAVSTARGLPVRQLSIDDMRAWFEESKLFNWSKVERATVQQQMDAGELAPGWTLALEQIVFLPDSPWRITFCGLPTAVAGSTLTPCGTVAEGHRLRLWVSQARGVCQDPTHDLCDEPFRGPFASDDPVALSPSVQVRIEPIQVAGEPAVPELAERDALVVSLNLSADSIPALVDYFAVGYDRATLEARMRTLLGTDTSRWVGVQEFMFGWIRERANTFPRSGENDVCHGPARMFYSDVLYNGEYDASTEAVAVLLTDHYCHVADTALPRFGDYLYNPGAHSARYILKDPTTGRDVVFSVQSGGISAYRFYWADEDMSGAPFAHQPMPDYRTVLVDTWRRCR